MEKILADLLKEIDVLQIIGKKDISLSGIESDSRKIQYGALFIAVRGTQSDGHNFILNTISSGAIAVVCEEVPDPLPCGVTFVRVKDSAKTLACLASAWYDHPSRKLKLVGITGTNGKTT